MSQTSPINVQAGAQADIENGLWRTERGGDGLVVVRGAYTPDPEPADWRDRLASFTRQVPGVAMAGPKRLTPDGSVFSLGEFVIHPKGFHHLGKGVDGKCYRFPEEVDTIAGGVAVIDAAAFDAVDGDQLLASLGQLGMIGLGLAVRRQGRRVLAVPQVIVSDTFSPKRHAGESDAFVQRFGFDWVAPDLDAVRQAHAGGGLVWNAFFHAGMMPFEKYDQRGAMHWESYQKADVFRQRADQLAAIGARFALPPEGVGGAVIDLGAGDGLCAHLIAQHGCEVIGIDPEKEGIAQAQRMCAAQTYPDAPKPPRFTVGFGDCMPMQGEAAACVCLFDVIEHLGNPIGVLNESARVLKPGGHLVVVTPAWQYGASSDPVYHGFEFTIEELNRLVNSAQDLAVVQNGQIGGVYRDLIVIARKN